MKLVYFIAAIMLAGGCNDKVHENVQKSSSQVATTLEDVSKTIHTVQQTANEIKKFSEDMAVTGERVKGIKGVELIGNSQWEYKVVSVDDASAETLQNSLNDLGKEGWELSTRLGSNRQASLVFKRRKEPGD
ncbi:MAG: DUF4177 domain-containing protein [Verrucomicrobiota bacterium]|jgi:hypothetical protein|nr:DUF4177 domain-containing protein [Verrucomicrobiota bacterium]MEE2813611.1 DUF4177 domain-containing protein [Verrucomicrobiota bacterium]